MADARRGRCDFLRMVGADGATIWITGLPRAGKSTLARAVERVAIKIGWRVRVLDGDELRRTTSRDLGFSPQDRTEQARRTAAMACDVAAGGGLAIVALISPYGADRRAVRDDHERLGLILIEVFVATPLSECERRDLAGLFAAARRGLVTDVTGIDAPFEAPESPDITVRTNEPSLHAAERIIGALARRLSGGPRGA